jgi:SLT domain-containing protein
MKGSRKRKPEVIVFEEPARKQRKENVVKLSKSQTSKYHCFFSSIKRDFKLKISLETTKISK